MHSLNAMSTVAPAVNNPSMRERHVVKKDITDRGQLQVMEVEAVQAKVTPNPLPAMEKHHYT